MNQANDQAWRKLHERAVLVDLHAHPSLKATLFRRRLTRRYQAVKNFFWPPSTRTSFPKLQAGGVDVLLSAIYVPEAPILQNIPLLKLLRLARRDIWQDVVEPPYFQATLNMLRGMEKQVAAHNAIKKDEQRPLQIIRSVEALEKVVDPALPDETRPIGLIHTVEGAHSLHGELSGKQETASTGASQRQIEEELLANLEVLFERSVASLTLAHFYPNQVVFPVFPFPEKLLAFTRQREVLERHDPTRGLTALGEKVVARMLDLGMIIDVSHCTPAARARVYQIVDSHRKNSLVMATHVGAYNINPSPYNLENWEIRWLADHGGVIGVIFMNYWLMPQETKLGLNYVSRTLEHFVNVAGSASVAAIGSDFDGFTDPPDDLVDASQMPKLTQRLWAEQASATERKYSEAALSQILGGNALRLLREGWGKQV